MSKKQFFILVLTTFVGGIIGGSLSSALFKSKYAGAEGNQPVSGYYNSYNNSYKISAGIEAAEINAERIVAKSIWVVPDLSQIKSKGYAKNAIEIRPTGDTMGGGIHIHTDKLTGGSFSQADFNADGILIQNSGQFSHLSSYGLEVNDHDNKVITLGIKDYGIGESSDPYTLSMTMSGPVNLPPVFEPMIKIKDRSKGIIILGILGSSFSAIPIGSDIGPMIGMDVKYNNAFWRRATVGVSLNGKAYLDLKKKDLK